MKNKFKSLLLTFTLVLSVILTGCSASVGAKIEKATVKNIVDEYNITNGDDVVNVFTQLGVTDTKKHSNKFKNGNGYFKLTDVNDRVYTVDCDNFNATCIRNESDTIIYSFDTTSAFDTVIENNIADNANYDIGVSAPNENYDIFSIYETNLDDATKYSYTTMYFTNGDHIYEIYPLRVLSEEYIDDVAAYDYKNDIEKILNKSVKSDEDITLPTDLFWSITECFIGSNYVDNSEKITLMKQAAALTYIVNNEFAKFDKCIYDEGTGTFYIRYLYEESYGIIEYTPTNSYVDVVLNNENISDEFLKIYTLLQ